MFPRLQDFIGAWHVMRSITHADGAAARFDGHATFTPDGAVLIYHETGILKLSTGHSMKAERRYCWVEDNGGLLHVMFEDGRAFHSISAEVKEAEHWCDPDTYEVTYAFEGWPEWSCRWKVSGPRKEYCMTSHYRRASSVT